jgi:hypothetical protein
MRPCCRTWACTTRCASSATSFPSIWPRSSRLGCVPLSLVGWVDGVDVWLDGWVDRWVVGWVDVCTPFASVMLRPPSSQPCHHLSPFIWGTSLSHTHTPCIHTYPPTTQHHPNHHHQNHTDRRARGPLRVAAHGRRPGLQRELHGETGGGAQAPCLHLWK